jgi:fumarate hydratase class II
MDKEGTAQRFEKDSMGEMRVPIDGLYGASTQRAVLNFPISGRRMPPGFIHSLGRVKRACAQANQELGTLDGHLAGLIGRAAGEIADGLHDSQFPVDVFQTGSGTSTNMNANEVIANRCSQLAGEPIGSKKPVHPNDHANLSQSSNDVIPTTLHLSVALAIRDKLGPALKTLEAALAKKGRAWRDVLKVGRTHTMDATPVTMGQVFSGYARQARKAVIRSETAIKSLEELAIGGTAVGTGLNAPVGFGETVCRILSEDTGISFREAESHFEAQSGRDDAVEVAGLLATIAASLGKMAGDIRLLGSGPRAGLTELVLPAVQPGSSIMPGKVNPVMCEMLIQVSHFVSGHCHTVARCGQDGQFELNVTLPLITHCLHESIDCLANGARVFAEKCVADLEVNQKRCQTLLDSSLMLVTALNPIVGYDEAARVAKKAFSENKTLIQVVVEMGLLTENEAKAVLDPRKVLGK